MTDTSKATARPWRVKGEDEDHDYYFIEDRDGTYVSPFTPQHAALIVQSVNSFETLLAALKFAVAELENCAMAGGNDQTTVDALIEPFRAAIKLAEEKP